MVIYYQNNILVNVSRVTTRINKLDGYIIACSVVNYKHKLYYLNNGCVFSYPEKVLYCELPDTTTKFIIYELKNCVVVIYQSLDDDVKIMLLKKGPDCYNIKDIINIDGAKEFYRRSRGEIFTDDGKIIHIINVVNDNEYFKMKTTLFDERYIQLFPNKLIYEDSEIKYYKDNENISYINIFGLRILLGDAYDIDNEVTNVEVDYYGNVKVITKDTSIVWVNYERKYNLITDAQNISFYYPQTRKVDVKSARKI